MKLYRQKFYTYKCCFSDMIQSTKTEERVCKECKATCKLLRGELQISISVNIKMFLDIWRHFGLGLG